MAAQRNYQFEGFDASTAFTTDVNGVSQDRWTNVGLSGLYCSAVMSDCTIKCAACKYFQAIFQGSFKESKEATVNLTEDDATIVHAVILFIYGCKYACPLPKPDHNNLEQHVNIYSLADKYQYPPLQNAAVPYLRAQVANASLTYGQLQSFLMLIDTVAPSGDK